MLSIHPSLSSPLVGRRTIRLLFKVLERFCPQPETQPPLASPLMQSLVCDKSLRLIQQVLTTHTDMFLDAMRNKHRSFTADGGREDCQLGSTTDSYGGGGLQSTHTSVDMREVELQVGLVASVVRVSVGATRNLEWYPALLRSADILQVGPHVEMFCLI